MARCCVAIALVGRRDVVFPLVGSCLNGPCGRHLGEVRFCKGHDSFPKRWGRLKNGSPVKVGVNADRSCVVNGVAGVVTGRSVRLVRWQR